MFYHEMSGQDRRAILEPEDNYPLLVTFDGRTQPLGRAEVQALLRAGQDFEVDESQASRILTERGSC
jgi:hypothetical protein